MSIIYFIIAIGILVMVHELGHFIIARRNDIRVENFSIGFGPKLLGFRQGETEFKIAPIPLGGYVKMMGEDPEDRDAMADERSFFRKSPWTRIRVTLAGPAANIIFAFIVMPLVFLIGRIEPAYLSEAPIVANVKAASPAEAAGFLKGDVIKKIDGKGVATWDDFHKVVLMSGDRKILVAFEREGRLSEKKVDVAIMPEIRGGYIGVEPIFFTGGETLIRQIVANGPAAKAGLKKNDTVLEIDGKATKGFADTISIIGSAGDRDVSFKIERDGGEMTVNIRPEFNKDLNRWVIGVAFDQKDLPLTKKKYGIVESLKKGWGECVKIIVLTWEVIKRLFTGGISYKALGGPILIAQVSIAAARSGIADFIYFLSLLSINLGILNLLPIPILDGGQIVFNAVEVVIRRPLSIKVRSIAQYAGMVLILGFLALITINDIDMVWGIKNIIQKIF